jgi:hypothetical protein
VSLLPGLKHSYLNVAATNLMFPVCYCCLECYYSRLGVIFLLVRTINCPLINCRYDMILCVQTDDTAQWVGDTAKVSAYREGKVIMPLV